MTLASLLPFLAVAGGLLVLLLGVAGLFKAFYRKVDQGVALIARLIANRLGSNLGKGISLFQKLSELVFSN